MITETIYVCYSHKDVKIANDLANDLIQSGAKVWIDSLHGKDEDDLKEAAIKSAKLVLIVTSKNALTDESLKQEKDFARDLNIDRILVKIEACDTASKMRWKKLPSVDLFTNRAEGMKMLVQKLNLDKKPLENDVKPEISQAIVKEPISNQLKTPQEQSEKLSMLISSDEIATVRTMYENQLRDTKIAIGFFIAASAAIILVLVFKFDYISNIFSNEELGDAANTAETAYDKITKFIPGVAAILPNAFGGISWSKMKDKKNRIIVINRLELKPDRMESNLNDYSKEQIQAVETELESLITI